MYTELNGKIEKISKLIYFATAQVSFVAAALPPLIISLTNYFVYDLQDDSFQEIQMMYDEVSFFLKRNLFWAEFD